MEKHICVGKKSQQWFVGPLESENFGQSIFIGRLISEAKRLVTKRQAARERAAKRHNELTEKLREQILNLE